MIGIFIAALFISACTTIDMSTYEDENIYAELEMNDPKQVSLTVTNRTNDEFTLDQNSSSYTHIDQRSPLAAVADTQVGAVVAPLQVPAGTRRTQNFAIEQAVTFTNGKRNISEWVPENTSKEQFSFAYRIGDIEQLITFPDSQGRVLLGKVEVSQDIAVPFFSSIIDRRRKLYDQAVTRAQNDFGKDGKKFKLVNIHYESKTNGFVENASLSADVIETP
jgi:hypothetical protein